jgi:D-arabinose 5-phosphate isomerase GutQ
MGDRAGHATLGDFDEGALLATARELVGREASALETTAARLDQSLIEAARMVLASTGKVITVGVGTNGPIARRLAHLLSTTGTSALFLHPVDALHGSLGAVDKGDVVIAISKGGQSAELNEFASRSKTRGAQLLVLTGVGDSPLGVLGDLTVVLPDHPEADPGGIVAMGSSLITSAWGDALAIVCMQVTGYGWDEVLHSHPFGAVGQMTTPEGTPTPDRSERQVPD